MAMDMFAFQHAQLGLPVGSYAPWRTAFSANVATLQSRAMPESAGRPTALSIIMRLEYRSGKNVGRFNI